MKMRNHHWAFNLALISGLGFLLLGGFSGLASAREIVLGMQCDRSGPTQTIGPFICDGAHDYIKLFNKKNSLGGGHTLRLFEIDHGYKVDRGLEAYERTKAAGQVTYFIYGTPHTYSLIKKLTADKVPGTSPGFGSAAAANGKKFPYLFPMAATYWSQAASAVKFVMDKWEGSKPPKIAYIYFDNPAGREPFPVLKDLAKKIGFELKMYAVPSPGIEMRPQVLDIARRYKADWVISHLFGRAPGVSLKEFRRVRYPMNRIISFIWGGGESDMDLAGWDNTEGYYSLQIAGVGQDHQVIRDIKKMYADEGKPPPKAMRISVYYNRGVLIAAFHARAVQLAVQKHGAANVTGVEAKEGFESIRDFTLGGFLPPLNVTPEDHEGGGWTQVYQIKAGEFVPVTDWIQGYRDVVMEHVRAG